MDRTRLSLLAVFVATGAGSLEDLTDDPVHPLERGREARLPGRLAGDDSRQEDKVAGDNRVGAIVEAYDTAVKEVLGKVVAVQNFGGGDILELSLTGRKDALIPFSQAAVPEIDIAAGFLRIDSVAAGLVEGDDKDASGKPASAIVGTPG